MHAVITLPITRSEGPAACQVHAMQHVMATDIAHLALLTCQGSCLCG